MFHFHVYLSRIDKSGRIKPKRIHKQILVELFSLEHGICMIQDCLAGGAIMCQQMWQIYSRIFFICFCQHALLQFRIIGSVSYNARFVLLYISALFKLFIPSPAKSQRGYIHVITLPFVRPQHFVHVKTLNKIVNRNGKCFKEKTTQPKSGKQLTTRKPLYPEPSCSWLLSNNVYQRNGRHTKLRNIIKEFVGYKTGQAETYCFSLLFFFVSLIQSPFPFSIL